MRAMMTGVANKFKGGTAEATTAFYNTLLLDGSTQSVDCGNDASLTISTNLTVSGFFDTTSDITTDQALLSRWNGGSGYLVYIFAGEVYMQINGVFAKAAISANTQYHFTGTYDGANMKIFINGTIADTVANTAAIADPGVNCYVGRYGSSRTAGSLSLPMVFNSILTDTDIIELQTPKQPENYSSSITDNYVLALPLNDGVVDPYIDRSANGNDGTAIGSPTFTGTQLEFTL